MMTRCLLLFTIVIATAYSLKDDADAISQLKMAGDSFDEPLDPSTGALVRLSLVTPRSARVTRDTQVRSRWATFRTIEREEPTADPLSQQRTRKVTLPPTFKRKSNNVPSEAVERTGPSPAVNSTSTRSTSEQVPIERPEECYEVPRTGPCLALIRSFHYDPSSGKCLPYIYGGCQGSRNRFSDPRECVRICKAKSFEWSPPSYSVVEP